MRCKLAGARVGNESGDGDLCTGSGGGVGVCDHYVSIGLRLNWRVNLREPTW